MSARLRDLDREVRRMRAPRPKRVPARASSMATRRPARSVAPVRSMVVDFGEPATFGAGVHAMSIDPAVTPTDVAWDHAVSDALAARGDGADSSFHAAMFSAEPITPDPFPPDTDADDNREPTAFAEEPAKLFAGGGDDEDAAAADGGNDDFGDFPSDDEEEQDGGVVQAKSARRAILDDDDRFWSVARAADAARTQLANDPGLATLHDPSDPESEADDELRRDLEQLKQRPVEPPAAQAMSAHSIFDQMTMATTFDVGTVAVTRTFDALDAELDRVERTRDRAAARAAQLSAPPPLAVDETVEDLAWIQQAIGQPDTAEPPSQSPPSTDVPIEPTNEQAESERSAP